MLKKQSKIVLVFIVLLNAFALIVGCSYRHPPKAMMSIEKAPMRVILIDDSHDIDPKTIQMVMRYIGSQAYHDYQFNEFTGLGIDYDAQEAKSDAVSRSVGIGVE